MANHSSILVMKNFRGACWGIVHGVAKLSTTERLTLSLQPVFTWILGTDELIFRQNQLK